MGEEKGKREGKRKESSGGEKEGERREGKEKDGGGRRRGREGRRLSLRNKREIHYNRKGW